MTAAPGHSQRHSLGASRIGGTPEVAVVLASTRSRAQLDACLASLIPQCRTAGVSLVVVRADTQDAVERLRSDAPGVRIVAAPPSATARELRTLGMLEAAGDIVALTDDSSVRDAAWVDPLRRARRILGPESLSAADEATGSARNQRADSPA
jgi:hypothetical protein